jgi:hypothetical protein
MISIARSVFIRTEDCPTALRIRVIQ